MIALLRSFSVLSKDASTHGQQEADVQPLALWYIDDCSTNCVTVAPHKLTHPKIKAVSEPGFLKKNSLI